MLIAFDVIRPLIPAVFLTVYLLLVRLLAPFFYGGIPGQGDMLLAMLSSGTLFSAIFLFQWTGTTPMTSTGKVWYGILAGLIAFLIVGCGLSSAGIVFVVLVVNIISAVIQALEALYADHCVNAVLLPKSRALEENGTNA